MLNKIRKLIGIPDETNSVDIIFEAAPAKSKKKKTVKKKPAKKKPVKKAAKKKPKKKKTKRK